MGNFCSKYVFCCCRPQRRPERPTEEPLEVSIKHQPPPDTAQASIGGEAETQEHDAIDKEQPNIEEMQPSEEAVGFSSVGEKQQSKSSIECFLEAKLQEPSTSAQFEGRMQELDQEKAQLLQQMDEEWKRKSSGSLEQESSSKKIKPAHSASSENLAMDDKMTTANEESNSSPINKPLFTATECSRSLLTAPEEEGGEPITVVQTAQLSMAMDEELHHFSSDSKPSLRIVSDKIISELKETLKRNGTESGKSFPSLKSETFAQEVLEAKERKETEGKQLEESQPQDLKESKPQDLKQTKESLTSLEQAQRQLEPNGALSTLEHTAEQIPVTDSTTSLATTISTTSKTSNEGGSSAGPKLKAKSRKRRDRSRRKTLQNEPDISSIRGNKSSSSIGAPNKQR